MSWEPPPRSPWVASLNGLARASADEARALVPLAEAELLEGARRATGLDDFGEPAFREGLRRLLDDLEREARLTLVGRLMARAEIARLLESRLRIERLFQAHPEIAEERIEAPIFVTGIARTGTSILHEYLGQDPASRVPLTWEMMFPAAAAGGRSEEAAEAIGRAEAELGAFDAVLPAIRTMHELDARLPNECIHLFAHAFASDMFTGFYHVPGYTLWKATTDPMPAYAEHRRLLQLLQWRRPRRRWVLKAPSHLANLPQLFATYPDAMVVLTHRDPLRVLASLASLMASLRWMRSDHVPYDEIVAAMALGHGMLPERVMQQRDEGIVPEERIVDVRYGDLVADPFATVRQVMERCGTGLSAEGEAALAAWIEERPQHRHGVHEYDFADTGLDLATERARHARYQARHDVPSEVVAG